MLKRGAQVFIFIGEIICRRLGTYYLVSKYFIEVSQSICGTISFLDLIGVILKR